MDYRYLGTNLAFHRRLQGLSQLALATRTNGVVSQAYISRAERGCRQLNPRLVQALAVALGVDVDALTRPPRFVTDPMSARAVAVRGAR